MHHRLGFQLVPGIDLNRDEDIDPDVDFDRIGDAITIPRNDDDDISTSLLTFKLKKVEIDPTKQKFFGKSRFDQLQCSQL